MKKKFGEDESKTRHALSTKCNDEAKTRQRKVQMSQAKQQQQQQPDETDDRL